MSRSANAQYNLAAPDSLAIRTANRVRYAMFDQFLRAFTPGEDDLVLDIGVTSDQEYESSNYFEALYPHKHRITAAGIDDARFLEKLYPGVRFEFADALNLPFKDRSFDYVHSSAVLEHVGSFANQRKMVCECARVARKGLFLTTPNRWFPVEFHTQLPLLHWLPKPLFRNILVKLGQTELAREENLNLMTGRELRRAASDIEGWRFISAKARLLGLTSNLILLGHRADENIPTRHQP
ncbi:MAG: class I SAM-dependent methyltransferase [Pseudorhodoplanes sp.]